MHAAQLGPGFDAEVFDQHPAGVPERLQRLRGSAAAVEGDHQRRAQGLAQREFRHEPGKFGHQFHVAAHPEHR